ITVRLTDDCGTAADNAQVVTTFSNGDPPLVLSRTNPSGATYSGTWSPGKSATQMTITVSGLSPGLAGASARLTGAVAANSIPPTLQPNGTVNGGSPDAGAALAPGTVALVSGSALAPATSQTNVVPLPTQVNGTSVLVGPYLAPIYTLSDGVLGIQIPTELE